jgi:hypothetical protein
MFLRASLILVLSVATASPLLGDQLTVAAKGKKGRPQMYSGEVVSFEGSTLKFKTTDRGIIELSANLYDINVTLGSFTSGGAGSPSNFPPPLAPGRIASSNPSHPKDVDLPIPQLPAAGPRVGSIGVGADMQVLPEVDLTACRDRGADSIGVVVGSTVTTVTGLVKEVANGRLSFQKGKQNAVQIYRLPGEVTSIRIGACGSSG